MPIVNGKRYPYTEEGIEAAAEAEAGTPSDADVIEAFGIIRLTDPTGSPTDTDDRVRAGDVLDRATSEQKDKARKELNIPDGMNMGGVTRDELGYMHGGMKFKKRGAIKYSTGGAVKGKGFAGTF